MLVTQGLKSLKGLRSNRIKQSITGIEYRYLSRIKG